MTSDRNATDIEVLHSPPVIIVADDDDDMDTDLSSLASQPPFYFSGGFVLPGPYPIPLIKEDSLLSRQERIPECPVRMIREKVELVSITLSRSVLRGSEASPRSTSVRGVTSCVGTVGLELR